jgi:hypothetical protein
MKKLWNNLKLMFSSGTKHYEIGGYLHSGSVIVYDGHMPAYYKEDGDDA